MTKTILAYDLAWTGLTGWCYWSFATGAPAATGQHKPSFSGPATEPNTIRHIGFEIRHRVRYDVETLKPDCVVYERTDWHQDAQGEDGKRKYAQERTVQAALARAEMALLFGVPDGVRIMALGANEVKSKFGAYKKEEVARLIATEHRALFEFREHKHGYLLERDSGVLLSHHITDAIAIARVAADEIRMREMIEASQNG
jgi:hypothetical protein